MGDAPIPPDDFDAAFEAAAARLRAAVAEACARPGPWPGRVGAAIEGVIGREAQVVVNLPGHFFDCGFHAPLERVETLSGEDGPVLFAFAGAQGIALDPAEFDCFLACWPGGPGYAWIELRLGDRLHLVIEPLGETE